MDTKYIPEDLVIYTSLMREHIAEICEVCETSYLIRFMGRNYARVASKEIKPITLTQEILKKNGWICKKEALCDVYKKDIYTILEFVREEGVFNFCVGRNNYIIRRVMHVHQLQHLFFGLGINREMKI